MPKQKKELNVTVYPMGEGTDEKPGIQSITTDADGKVLVVTLSDGTNVTDPAEIAKLGVR